jgi:hypothetical protein
MAAVRRSLILIVLAVALVVSACGGDDDNKKSDDASPTTVATSDSSSSSTAPTTAATTTTTVDLPTTSLPCQAIPAPTAPVKSPVPGKSVYLTKVDRQGDACRDHVYFDFAPKTTDAPGYEVSYGSPPFTADGSGAPVKVAGNAFVVVKIQPGYGYDFETGAKTYTGPTRFTPPGAKYVKEVVETGDFEGVLTWVIGLDTKRPFSVQATGTPKPQLVVTIA